MDVKTAVLVYTRATLLGDDDLARVVVEKAAKLPLQKISMDTLRELPTSALHNLVSTELLECFEQHLKCTAVVIRYARTHNILETLSWLSNYGATKKVTTCILAGDVETALKPLYDLL